MLIIKCVKKNGENIFINTQNILYFEPISGSRNTCIVMCNGEKIIVQDDIYSIYDQIKQ